MAINILKQDHSVPGAAAHFSRQELDRVLSHYDVGEVGKTESLIAGNVSTPKKIITSEKGTFLLKRRPSGKDDTYHIELAHAVQAHLEKNGFVVAGLVPTRDENRTALCDGNHAYELFNFIPGSRYSGSAEEAADAGRKLAMFHLCLCDFSCDWQPLHRTYHGSNSVRVNLKTVCSSKELRHRNWSLRQNAKELLFHYNESSTRVNELGFDSSPQQIVHGDWHGGNMLFASKKVVCVLDFDSVKIAPPITDIAGGGLHFSIVAGRPNPADWPAYLDQAKLANFIAGYRQHADVDKKMLQALPDLMIEIMIAESVLPIAATGFFGHLSGLDFLKMVHRKCDWIDENRGLLKEAILQ